MPKGDYVAITEYFRGVICKTLEPNIMWPDGQLQCQIQLGWIYIDTLKSHSVSSTSASQQQYQPEKLAAVLAGNTINQRMEAAATATATDQRSESDFERLYYKPTNSNQMGQAVLSTSSTDSQQTSH